MPMRNIIPNMSPSRYLWGVLYSVFFTLASFSFYSTEMCTKIHSILYVAISFLVYLLLIPMVYLFYCATKERVSRAIVNLAPKFLIRVSFPLACVCMRTYFHDAALWACMGALGSLFCLLVCFINPEDYGLSDYFVGLWLGVFVNLEGILGKCIVATIIMNSKPLSRAIVAERR